MVVGEVAPLAPLLIPLGEVLLWALAFAFCIGVVYIARAMFGTASGAVGWIPFVGKVIASSLTSIEQKIVNIMSSAAESCDAKMGAALHQLARLIDWLGHEIAAHANLLAILSQLMLGPGFAAALQQLIARLTHTTKAQQSVTDAIVRRVIAAERRLQHGIGADVLPRIRTAEHEIDRVIGKDLPAIRARERTLERGGLNLWRWVRTHPLSVGSAAFAGAVAWALARLGAGWIRCGNFTRNRKQLCGMDPDLFDTLIADTLLVVGTLSLVQFAEEMVAVTETAVRPIQSFWRAG